jgi:hypothetical protein
VNRLARITDPATSKASALTASEAVESELRTVLTRLVQFGRGSSRTLAAGNHAFRFVIAKRLSVLETRGLAERVQTEIDPETGRKAEVWRATSAGVEAVQR